jgi:hypothetical protein
MTCFRLSNGKTLNEFCNEYNLPYMSVWRRLDAGMCIEEAIAKSMEHKGYKGNPKYLYKGKSVAEMLGGYQSNAYHRFFYRISKGLSIEKAVEEVLK